ncbi:hypothetical protein [Ornithinimicrobium faecis]|uniref:hypothetical protein n=1 Tax=Ornithinimicrobium faecis TaxID=2934158 RepID=UPI0021192551|nr:hypothetical protein [Ornithinimicrobium sp. HY1745]
MASDAASTPDRPDAADILDELDGARTRLAQRLVTPWWFKALSSLIVALLFIGVGMTFDNFPFGSDSTGTLLVAVSVASAPTVLLWLLRHVTGASVDRYQGAWTGASLALIGLLVACMAIQSLLDVPWAFLAGAGAGFVLTYVLEMRTDTGLRRGELPARVVESRA